MARIVFDLDGTLIDSAPDIGGIANRLLDRDGLPRLTGEEVRSFIGNGAPVFIRRMRQARGIPDTRQPQLLADFVALYDTAFDLTTLYDGVTDVLADLSAQGHALGVCTNKPHRPATRALEHFDLARWFSATVGGDSLACRKPDPAPLEAAFDALGDGPMIYVGDSEVDAETACRAGVPFLLFTEGYRKAPVGDLPHFAAFSAWRQLHPLIARILA